MGSEMCIRDSEKTAAEDACKAEHILSEQTLEKIRERAIETDAELGKTVK